jgi:outer membrane protein, heavy metal efflux system
VQYKTRMLPMAEHAYELSRKGYDAGRYSWLELVKTQHDLAAFRVRYIEALLVAHKASAQLDQFRTGEDQ